MRLKPFIFLILIGTILSWIGWGFVLFTVDPFYADTIAFVFFYVSLGIALIGTISLICLLMYHIFFPLDAPVYRVVSRSLRDGAVIALLLITLLILQGLQLLTIWNIGIFAIFALLVLSFYLTVQGQHS